MARDDDKALSDEGRIQVDFRSVGLEYPDGQVALDGVTLTVRAGEHLCILGGNGSGKSTLVQLMNALLVPTSGEARIFGAPCLDHAAALAARRRAAMVFQHPEDQMTTSVVEEDVAFGPENLGLPSNEIERRVRRSLEAVGMSSLAKADPADLSGGQKQRVAIAGALAMEPELLLLDEPAAMLDTEGRRAIQGIVEGLNARGITIVHVTHFMEDALLAKRVVVMRAGRVAFDGAPTDLFSQPGLVSELDLELPAHLRLAALLDESGMALPLAADADGLLDAIADLAPRASAPERDPRADAVPAEGGRRADGDSIAFHGVDFSYATARNARRRPGLLARHRQGAEPAPLALADASFRVPEGSITALVGRTGSGKSTAIELACALKVPCSGSIEVDGIDTADLGRRRELRRRVGYVSQLPERQLFAETVFDDVAFGPRNLGVEEPELAESVMRALAATGIDPTEELLARSPFSLSGGQQRCVALAGVLAMGQPVIVLDEPMAGLDPRGRRELSSLLRRLRHEGVTLLMVTHSMDDVAELADHVVALDSGRVVAEGSPREVFLDAKRDPALASLGAPPALELARALERRGMHVTRQPLTIDELASEVIAHGAAR